VLAAANRLRTSVEFADTVRRGRRVSRPLLAVHLLVLPDGAPPRVGLVVSKGVGGSVVRHRVSRRLRHQVRDRLPQLPAGCRLVLRAHPDAATASSAQLADDLDAAIARALQPRPDRTGNDRPPLRGSASGPRR
jgi:ribonuclease P protein component